MKKLIVGLCTALCAAVGLAAERSVEIVETTRDADGHPISFTLGFTGESEEACPLYMLCDWDDRGGSTNGWAYVEQLQDVAVGETTRVVPAPAGFSEKYFTARFALVAEADPATASSYVTDGLEAMWDGLENAGLGQEHDNAATVWKDLSGNAFDWNLTPGNSEWASDGLVLKEKGAGSTTDENKSIFKGKVRTIEFVYENSKKRHGIILALGSLGRTAYLYTDADGRVGYYDYQGQLVPLNETIAYSVTYKGTGDNPEGVNSAWVNGAEEKNDGMGDYWNIGNLYLGSRGGNDCPAKGTIKAIRIYSRVLSNDERSANYKADAVRYLGETKVLKTTSAVFDTPVWTYDPATSKLTHRSSGWVLTASASGSNLTLTGKDASGAADPKTIDLSGLVMSEEPKVYSITTMNSSFMGGDKTITDVVLPSTMKTINGDSFVWCTALKHVTPFLSSVTYVGMDGFRGCTSLESPLVLGVDTPITLPANYQFEGCSSIPSITLGEITTVIPERCFADCTGVKMVYLTEHFPTQTTGGRKPFAGWKEYQSRWVMPKDSEFWAEFVKTSSYVTRWDDLTPEQQQLYKSTYTADGYDCVGTIAMDFNKQWLVQPSTNEVFYATLNIVGLPETLAPDQVQPSYGTTNATDCLPLTCTAPEYKPMGLVIWRCTGYTLEKLGEGGVYEPVAEESKQSVVFNPKEAGEYRLTWNWVKAGYRDDLPSFYGDCPYTITTNGTASVEGYFPADSVVSYTVTPTTSAPFVRWYGDLGDNDPESKTITVTMNKSHRVMPYLATPWHLNEAKNKITDGYWTNDASVVNGEVTIGSIKAEPLTGILDLTKPIVSGETFVGIGNSAFKNGGSSYSQWGDFSVKLPNTLCWIGNEAFRDNKVLVSVEPFLPNTVTNIGHVCFGGCSALKGDLSVLASTPVNVVGDWNFGSCPKLTSATLGNNVTTIPGSMFKSCSMLTNVVMSGAVTAIGNNAFEGCSALKDVVMPGSVTAIGGGAFGGCSSLTNAVISNSIKTIGGYAFSGCSALKHVEPLLPDALESLGDEAFSGCSQLEGEVSFGWTKTGVVTGYHNKNFKNCVKLTSVRFGPKQQHPQGSMFCYCSGMRTVYLGGEYPIFENGDWMTWGAYQVRIYVPKNVASIETFITESVTPWEELDENVQKKYLDAYPDDPLPIGLTKGTVTATNPWPSQWVLYWKSPWLAKNFMLIIK